MNLKAIMPTLRVLLLTVCFLPFLASMPGSSETGVPPDFSTRINAFTFDFLKKEAASGVQNAAMSPMSIFSGVAISYVASGGATRQALARALRYPADNAALERDLNDLHRGLFASGRRRGVELQMAGSVWLSDTHARFRREYWSEILHFGVTPSLNSVSFGDGNKASSEINAWVSQITHGRITASVQPGDFASRSGPGVTDEPALVSVNAVYFKAGWMSRFNSPETTNRAFHTSSGADIETPSMHQSGPFLYSENESFKFLEMPYRGGAFSMVVVLPMGNAGPQAMLAALTPDAVVDLKRSAFPRTVDILFPKFVVDTCIDAKSMLTDMGAGVAFDNGKADFGGMIAPTPEASRVYMSSVRHDAWMEVGEEGTEAAAATAAVDYSIGCSAEAMPMPAVFHADHPFLFFIVHNPSRSILFGGWIGNPAKLEAAGSLLN